MACLRFSAASLSGNFASNETLETGLLTLRIAAPDAEEWRNLYEAYHR